MIPAPYERRMAPDGVIFGAIKLLACSGFTVDETLRKRDEKVIRSDID